MAHEPAHPGPRDGSGPLVWILGGVIVALIVLILKISTAPSWNDQAFIYVVVGGLAGLLLRLVFRRFKRRDKGRPFRS